MDGCGHRSSLNRDQSECSRGRAKLEDARESYPSTKYPMIRSAVRQRALGEFLRKHGETIHPADDSRAVERRRRTSGLRREEVARRRVELQAAVDEISFQRVRDRIRLIYRLRRVAARGDPCRPRAQRGELSTPSGRLCARRPVRRCPVPPEGRDQALGALPCRQRGGRRDAGRWRVFRRRRAGRSGGSHRNGRDQG